ncbi:hypothetical protein QQP08_026577 [Theobroma cacao]|nr:hypothetical protein QQP08_026577 [Theobroma cacao]
MPSAFSKLHPTSDRNGDNHETCILHSYNSPTLTQEKRKESLLRLLDPISSTVRTPFTASKLHRSSLFFSVGIKKSPKRDYKNLQEKKKGKQSLF